MKKLEMDFGWSPKSLVDLLQSNYSLNESLNGFRERLARGLQDARFAHEMVTSGQRA